MKKDTKEIIFELIRLNAPRGVQVELKENTTFFGDLKYDSLALISLLADIEEEFQLEFDDMEESLEITKIYSVLGMLDEKSPLIRKRPFREVHHTATRAALIGGGLVPRPGEISLAHGGIQEERDRSAAPAFGRKERTDIKNIRKLQVPGRFYSGSRDEPLSMRMLSG